MSYKNWNKLQSYKQPNQNKILSTGCENNACCAPTCKITPGNFTAPTISAPKFTFPTFEYSIPKFKCKSPQIKYKPGKISCKQTKPIKVECGTCCAPSTVPSVKNVKKNITKVHGKGVGIYNNNNNGLF